jgi:hypothetical protein
MGYYLLPLVLFEVYPGLSTTVFFCGFFKAVAASFWHIFFP